VDFQVVPLRRRQWRPGPIEWFRFFHICVLRVRQLHIKRVRPVGGDGTVIVG